ncbi:MAG: SUMF1/EgtB/PvdO family nonheme iron enzyme [Phycisphaeraceae bacterium]|nr:SUMF1/EgtB/PvdO family nonheme iron enzyme [Phycisphaeraceae bacterium]
MSVNRVCLSVMISLCAVLCPAAESDMSSCYTRKATWAETMVSTRLAYRAWQETSESPDVAIRPGPWYEAGPFEGSFKTVCIPEKGVDLSAKKADGKPLWVKRKKYKDGKVNGLTPNVVGPTYLYRTIKAPQSTSVLAGLGSDDGLVLWLNGKKILSKDVPRGTVPDADRATLALNAGENTLLLKVYNMRGGHSFYFSTESSKASPLWQRMEKAFPQESAWMKRDLGIQDCLTWFREPGDRTQEEALIRNKLNQTSVLKSIVGQDLEALVQAGASGDDASWLTLYHKACHYEEAFKALGQVDIEGLRLAIEDLTQTYPKRYSRRYLKELPRYEDRLKQEVTRLEQTGQIDAVQVSHLAEALSAFQSEALLANPLLDLDSLVLIRRNLGGSARKAMSKAIGMASLNSHNNTSITDAATAWDNEIISLTDLRSGGKSRILMKPRGKQLITDMDLNFDADKLMFSMPGPNERWHIFEMDVQGNHVRQVTPSDVPDVDHFDSCYLPNGKIIYTSTANFQGLPCEGGSRPMSSLYQMDAQGQNIRQLTFEQDSDWCPTMLNNGRLLYLRWEYSDICHYFSRILFHMNPDGTEQMEYYGSNSYWPNAFFYARPLPNHPSRVVGIVGGHHGISRSGRLMILDPAKGRHEAKGVVQEIPGRGKVVEPVIIDRLVDGVWPQFLHPFPLDDKYFVVSAKMDANALWGVYLVDVFDNMTLIAEQEGTALLEPLPLRAQKRPPVIPDKVDLTQKESIVFLTDIYLGPGLKGIPRGKVKNLRLFAYHFAHNKTGGHNSVGVESSWDIKRILGTVPVEEGGSAMFRIPSNTPISIQPLDEQGRALQIMRSWFVGMPGEVVSCVGCHEPQNTTAMPVMTQAATKVPEAIRLWQGAVRPFGFDLEVAPVLDKYCVACHDGQKEGRPNFADRSPAGRFNEAYMALHPYIRRPGPESDVYVLKPMEYHASTSELIQMLEAGHHGVQLDSAAWEVLTTWIDLNVPYRGQWRPPAWRDGDQNERRMALAKQYAGIEDDPEGEYDLKRQLLAERRPVTPIKPKRQQRAVFAMPTVSAWPMDQVQARTLQRQAGIQTRRKIDLGHGVILDMVLIPAGQFVMGSIQGHALEQPPSLVRIDKPFWMGVCETTNAQYGLFDASHDSRFIDQQWKDHTTPGYPANLPDQPVIRVSWLEANAFCQWLSRKTGESVTLPTEDQWEWACRTGTDKAFSFGDLDTDFSTHANLADHSIELLAVQGVNPQPVSNPNRFLNFVPRDERFNDQAKIVSEVGAYQANAWGLKDMHGNVAEWTHTTMAPYPYVADDGRNVQENTGKKVVRGGSWRDRPKRSTSSFRLSYEPYQKVFNVGFRIIIEASGDTPPTAVAVETR